MSASRELARYAVASRWSDLPAAVRHEAARALVNWIGCPIRGARDDAVERTLAALAPFSGPAEASILGRAERLDPFKAALLTCLASGVSDFDDTHLATVIHPTGPAASALLALAERQPIRGADFLHALALGIEIQCRVGNALMAPPARCSSAWFPTGVTGGIGAAVAAGRILGLDESQMLAAIALAASRAAGARETHGSMIKGFAAACAAEEGLFAAFLAQRGITGPEAPIEGPRGLGRLVSEETNYPALTAGLGRDFAMLDNAYKAFPSGIVTHPAITGALEIAAAEDIDAAEIAAARVIVHPLCLELCGRHEPKTATEGTFSVYHWVAIALSRRRISIAQFSDAMINDPAIAALRGRVEARANPAYRLDEAEIEIVLRDGRASRHHVDRAIGSLARPLDDAALDAKLRDLVDGSLSPARADELARTCWTLAEAPDARVVIEAARPA